MFRELTYKKKFFLLIILFVMLSFTAYKRSYKNAIEAIGFYSDSKNNIAENLNVPQELSLLKREVQTLDNIIGKKASNPEIVQNSLLDFLSGQELNVTVSKINPVHRSEDHYFNIYSNLITLEGDFNNLLNTVYAFEKDFEYARIASLKFYLTKNARNGKKELFNDIIFQNYEKQK